MPKFPLNATIENGIPKWEDIEKKVRIIKYLEGKRVTFWVEEFSNKRSDRQNKYLWGIAYPDAAEGFQNAGYDINADEAHEVFGDMFLRGTRINQVTGEELSIVKSSARLSTSDFEQYTERIRRYCAENLNWHVRSPNEELPVTP